jgi:hypothetical protein
MIVATSQVAQMRTAPAGGAARSCSPRAPSKERLPAHGKDGAVGKVGARPRQTGSLEWQAGLMPVAIHGG